MSKIEKKDFLSMDFAERMIRIEQNVSASFDKPVKYDQTNFFNSLTLNQKEKFRTWLKNKGKRRMLAGIFILLPILFVALINFDFTGNIIRESINEQLVYPLTNIFLGIFIIILLIFIILFIRKKIRESNFKKNARIIDELLIKKHSTKPHLRHIEHKIRHRHRT